MKEGSRSWLAVSPVLALFAVLLIPQATRTEAEVSSLSQTSADPKTIFEAKCAECHGKDGRARTFRSKHFVHARDLTDASWQGNVTDERLFNSIRNGKGKMPAFGKKLSDNQIDALVAYVRQLKK